MNTETKLATYNPWLVIIGLIGLTALSTWSLVAAILGGEEARNFPVLLGGFILGITIVSLAINGFFMLNPNQGKVLTLFGKYVGTCRDAGFHWANPLCTKKPISLRLRNFNTAAIRVNDASGNPIEIGAVVVWKVTDTAKALFDVESYENFVSIQCETAIRTLASHYPYDSPEDEHPSLRGNPDIVAKQLVDHVQDRLDLAGVVVQEARISHLAYAPEIAQVMLKRQQAEAMIAARRKIVDGAVGMVQMALTQLETLGIVHLDDERKASMVNNLLVALVSESEAQPIINTGSIYS